MTEWSDITLETAGCLLIAVVAYKIYRIKFSAESECCDRGISMKMSGPGERTPRVIKDTFTDLELQKPELHRITNS